MTERKRRRLVPEVVQSSAMDCGPAALKALLEGHGVSVSYGRLREACQTDVDGTSIETLEELAAGLGVPVEQVLLPKDLVLLEQAGSLPAIAVMRLPNGNTHFAVIWSLAFGIAQVMDPASGRRWLTRGQLLHELYEHVMTVPASDWREWASSEEGKRLLRHRLRAVGVSEESIRGLLERALSDPGWRSLAALDASARAVRSMVDAGAARPGREATELVASLFNKGSRDETAIPKGYRSVRPQGDGELVIRGAVVLRPRRKPAAAAEGPISVPPAVEAAREEKPVRAARELGRLLVRDSVLTPAALVAAFFGAATAIVIEALLFRSLLELTPLFGLSEYRVGIVAALFAFMLVVLFIDLSAVTGELRLGRRLETRLRLAFQEKIPRLGDRYFHSRLTSDMAERQHSLHRLRMLPKLGGELLRSGFELVLTAAALVWLQPEATPIVLLVFAASLGIPFLGQPILHERDLRVRSHVGGLSRFYLDALLGLVPVRVHGAERAIRTEHESLLVEWARARLGLQRAAVALEAAQFLAGYGLIVLLLLAYLNRGGEPTLVLLLAYWALNLPVLGLEIVRLAWRYPEERNITLRVTEPLRALEEKDAAPRADGEVPSGSSSQAISIRMENVGVRAGGHRILDGIDLAIEPGAHVAVVGPSGAGKTSLFGLLLGWHFPDTGRVLLDGAVLSGDRLAEVRSRIAWVDPSVQLWNRSLIDNLRYGNGHDAAAALSEVVERAELLAVLEMLPDGHQTRLGEGGGLVSGGEGQRVRLARAFLRDNVRLALLDEPFRGLDRRHRSELLRRARELWRGASLLCITHDLSETESFDRVLVIDGGRLVEDGHPAELAANRTSRYRRLLDSERELAKLWSDGGWRRWEIEDGFLVERERSDAR